MDGKNELILWKLSSIEMKILIDITCILNWIQIQLEKKKDVNWWRKYGKFVCDYGVEILFLKKFKFKKTSFHASFWKWARQISG